jgi:hypothetical protein
MEKIDLTNYEAFFLDYSEGNLGEEEKYDLFNFLEAHPELKAEFELDFGDIQLNAASIQFDDKPSLKKRDEDLVVTMSTIDDLMIASIERQLSAKEEELVLRYVRENNLQTKFAYYQASILKADTSVVYPEKEKLKMKTGVVISFPFWARVASVAAVGLLLITMTVDWNNPINDNVGGRNKASLLGDSSFQTNPTDKIQPVDELTPENGGGTAHYQPTKQNTNSSMSPQKSPELMPEVNFPDKIVENPDDKEIKIDSLTINEHPGIEIVEDDQNNPVPFEKVGSQNPNGDLADFKKYQKEEPYKIVTDFVGNIVNTDINYTKNKDLASNNYVGYGFKIGNFEFERKKTK